VEDSIIPYIQALFLEFRVWYKYVLATIGFYLPGVGADPRMQTEGGVLFLNALSTWRGLIFIVHLGRQRFEATTDLPGNYPV
jgi:hypothetical protein